MEKFDAIKKLYPHVVTLRDDVAYDVNDNEVSYDNTAVQAEIDSEAYKDARASAYKSLAEQLDMLYWDGVNGTSTWSEHIAAVKAAHPKPTE